MKTQKLEKEQPSGWTPASVRSVMRDTFPSVSDGAIFVSLLGLALLVVLGITQVAAVAMTSKTIEWLVLGTIIVSGQWAYREDTTNKRNR